MVVLKNNGVEISIISGFLIFILKYTDNKGIMGEFQLNKRPDENDYQYHKRLIYGKLVDKTLADYDYSELSELIYGKRFSPDVARRLMYGSKRTLDLIDKHGLATTCSDDAIKEIDSKIDELRKERQKYFDQRREYNKLLTREARQENLESRLVEAANHLNESIGFLFSEDTDYIDVGDNEALLVFSDWHYGMITDNMYNSFNTEICKERVKTVVNNAIERIKLHRCGRLHIVFLGDAIAGAIHTSSRVSSEELVVDQLMQASEILAQAITKLATSVPDVIVYSTFGNHGRVVPSKKDNIHDDNMERIIGWWLEERLKSIDNVQVVDTDTNEFILIDMCGHMVCATHGDIDNVFSSPKILYTLFSKKYGIDLDYIILGDKHHSESFEELGITSMICGALCGSDNYANDKRLFSTPSQLMLIFNNDGLDAEYRLVCQ